MRLWGGAIGLVFVLEHALPSHRITLSMNAQPDSLKSHWSSWTKRCRKARKVRTAGTTQQPGFWPRAGNIAGAEYLCFGTPPRLGDASSPLILGKRFGGCSTSVAPGTIAGIRQ